MVDDPHLQQRLLRIESPKPRVEEEVPMKLRIQGNSLRLRVSRSELDRFSMGERIQETVYFGPEVDAKLTYALESNEAVAEMTVVYDSHEVTVQIPLALGRRWALDQSAGLSGSKHLGMGRTLDILVEKDFACLDRSEAENEDTFPNPHLQDVCQQHIMPLARQSSGPVSTPDERQVD